GAFNEIIHAVTLAFDDHLHPAMNQSVHGRRAHERIAEDRGPFGEITVGGNDRGSPLVAIADDLIQVGLVVLTQRGQPEVIQDQKLHRADLFQPTFAAAVSATRLHPGQKMAGSTGEYFVAPAAGFVPEGLSQMALAHSRGADEEHVLVFGNELAGSKLADGWFMDARIETEIKCLQGLVRLEAAAGEATTQLFEISPLYLIGEQHLQELAEAPLLPHGLRNACLQCLADPG